MDEEGLMAEFGSSHPIRFITKSEKPEMVECLDCEAKSHAFALEDTHFDCPKLEKLRKAILFVLWNTDWPVGD